MATDDDIVDGAVPLRRVEALDQTRHVALMALPPQPEATARASLRRLRDHRRRFPYTELIVAGGRAFDADAMTRELRRHHPGELPAVHVVGVGDMDGANALAMGLRRHEVPVGTVFGLDAFTDPPTDQTWGRLRSEAVVRLATAAPLRAGTSATPQVFGVPGVDLLAGQLAQLDDVPLGTFTVCDWPALLALHDTVAADGGERYQRLLLHLDNLAPQRSVAGLGAAQYRPVDVVAMDAGDIYGPTDQLAALRQAVVLARELGDTTRVDVPFVARLAGGGVLSQPERDGMARDNVRPEHRDRRPESRGCDYLWTHDTARGAARLPAGHGPVYLIRAGEHPTVVAPDGESVPAGLHGVDGLPDGLAHLRHAFPLIADRAHRHDTTGTRNPARPGHHTRLPAPPGKPGSEIRQPRRP